MKAVPATPGVYIIAAGRPLHRAVGIDEEGVLDIGESLDLRSRIKSFVRCATKRGDEGHMAGWRYAYLNMTAHFEFKILLIRWAIAPSKKDAEAMEALLLSE